MHTHLQTHTHAHTPANTHIHTHTHWQGVGDSQPLLPGPLVIPSSLPPPQSNDGSVSGAGALHRLRGHQASLQLAEAAVTANGGKSPRQLAELLTPRSGSGQTSGGGALGVLSQGGGSPLQPGVRGEESVGGARWGGPVPDDSAGPLTPFSHQQQQQQQQGHGQGRRAFASVPGFVMERGGGMLPGGVQVRTVGGLHDTGTPAGQLLDRPRTAVSGAAAAGARVGGAFERLHANYLVADPASARPPSGPGAAAGGRGRASDQEADALDSDRGSAPSRLYPAGGTPPQQPYGSRQPQRQQHQRPQTALPAGVRGGGGPGWPLGMPLPFGGLVDLPPGAIPPDVFGVGRAEVLRGSGFASPSPQGLPPPNPRSQWSPQDLSQAEDRVWGSMMVVHAGGVGSGGGGARGARPMSAGSPTHAHLAAQDPSMAAASVEAQWRPLAGLPPPARRRAQQPPAGDAHPAPRSSQTSPEREREHEGLLPRLPLEQMLQNGGPPPSMSHNLYQATPAGAFRVRHITATPQKGVQLGRREEGEEGAPQMAPPSQAAMLAALTGHTTGLSVPMHGFALYPAGAPAGAQLHRPGEGRLWLCWGCPGWGGVGESGIGRGVVIVTQSAPAFCLLVGHL